MDNMKMLKGVEKFKSRAISICYQDVQVEQNVESTALVSEYFCRDLFIKLNDDFNIKAKQMNRPLLKQIRHLTNYDVRLNCKDETGSVKNCTNDFDKYPPGKRLTFYIFDLSKQEPKIESIEKHEEKKKDFNLQIHHLLGSLSTQSMTINVKGLSFKDLEDKIKQQFNIQERSTIIFINYQTKEIISPDKFIQVSLYMTQHQIQAIAFKENYTAG